MAALAPTVRNELVAAFDSAGVTYPPTEVTLVALKRERVLHVWARGRGSDGREQTWVRALTYPILGASGVPGPKLREGDSQVPEGVYRIEGLNPNSRFHLSMKIDYPNAFDRKMAEREGRDRPGSDIFIHGGSESVGCLAMGDNAAQELFVLIADVGTDRSRVLLCPSDPALPFRRDGARDLPAWISEIDGALSTAFAAIAAPAETDRAPSATSD